MKREFLFRILYNKIMNAIEKFISDIDKIKKYDRANNGGHYDGKRACQQISELFERNNRNVEGVARQISDYWFNTYILGSADAASEPSDENISRLRAFQAFIDNDESENFDVLSSDDWENLRDFVNFEAGTLDLDALQNMMGMILDHGGL